MSDTTRDPVSKAGEGKPEQEAWAHGQVVELAAVRGARGGVTTISKREVAERYGVTVRTVSRWMARGLPYLKPYEGGAVRFRPVEVEAWMRRHGSASQRRRAEKLRATASPTVSLRPDCADAHVQPPVSEDFQKLLDEHPEWPKAWREQIAALGQQASVLPAAGRGRQRSSAHPPEACERPSRAVESSTEGLRRDQSASGAVEPERGSVAPAVEPWVDVAAVAAHLACTEDHIRELAKRDDARRVPHRKEGRRLLFKLSRVDDWLERTGAH